MKVLGANDFVERRYATAPADAAVHLAHDFEIDPKLESVPRVRVVGNDDGFRSVGGRY